MSAVFNPDVARLYMCPLIYVSAYVKGYEVSEEKATTIVNCGESSVVVILRSFRQVAARDAYLTIKLCRPIGNPEKEVFVIVIDEDNDLQKLRERPSPILHPDLLWAMPMLEEGAEIFNPIP